MVGWLSALSSWIFFLGIHAVGVLGLGFGGWGWDGGWGWCFKLIIGEVSSSLSLSCLAWNTVWTSLHTLISPIFMCGCLALCKTTDGAHMGLLLAIQPRYTLPCPLNVMDAINFTVFWIFYTDPNETDHWIEIKKKRCILKSLYLRDTDQGVWMI